MTLTAVIAVALLPLMAAISPGPAVVMAAPTGMFLALGIGVGGVIWAAAALFGLTLVFAAAPALLWALRITGGICLIRLAVGLWRNAGQPLDTGHAGRLPRSGAAARGRFPLRSAIQNLPLLQTSAKRRC